MDQLSKVDASGSGQSPLVERKNTTDTKSPQTIKLVLSAILAAVGVILSYLNPFGYFTIFGAKINPFAHFINSIAGVLMGPWYALLTAFIIAIVRFSFGIGTILAFPGGMSGALVVGLFQLMLKRKYPGNLRKIALAGLTDPIGTVFIGGTISAYLIPTPMLTFWWLFALSCIPGAILGYLTLLYLVQARWMEPYIKSGRLLE